MFPKPPPPPTVAFGKLPKLPFPEKYKAEGLAYKLETIDGKLPTFIDQLPVYFTPEPVTNIRSLDSAREKASRLNFNPVGETIVQNIPNVYIFKRNNSSALLTINIITGIFSISYDLSTDPSIYRYRPDSETGAIESVKQYLSQGGVDAPDLTGKPNTVLLKIENGKLIKAISLSESNFIKVSLFRKNILYLENEYISVSQDYPEGNVWFLTNGSGVFAGEFHYYKIDEGKFGTYPIKNSQTAWDELSSGKAYISNIDNINEKSITIRNVYIGYYDAGQYTEYYQPVYVFEGDNNFFAFVPAITDEYYGI
jgi:hypothetical protein